MNQPIPSQARALLPQLGSYTPLRQLLMKLTSRLFAAPYARHLGTTPYLYFVKCFQPPPVPASDPPAHRPTSRSCLREACTVLCRSFSTCPNPSRRVTVRASSSARPAWAASVFSFSSFHRWLHCYVGCRPRWSFGSRRRSEEYKRKREKREGPWTAGWFSCQGKRYIQPAVPM